MSALADRRLNLDARGEILAPRCFVGLVACCVVGIWGCSKGPERVTSADVDELEDVCISNGRRSSSRSDCIVEAFCRCAASDYERRTDNRAEYRSIMSGIHSYLDDSGYYCTDSAESACPSDREEEKEEEDESEEAARPVYIPPGPARGLPVAAENSFTLGSPRTLVEQVQGKPDKIDRLLGETWWYADSQVEFRGGKVYAWNSGTVPLRVTLVPKDMKRYEDARARSRFTLGDTKDDLLGVHGVPTHLDRLLGETWWYQGSRVEFRGAKIVSWNSAHYAALAIYLEPKDPAKAASARERGRYGKGATKDEVLAVEGVPTHIELLLGETWWYGPSRVEFASGKVRGWNSSPLQPLKGATTNLTPPPKH